MSTAEDFVGRNCPLCGAIDSLQTDEALGEVACTECAQVVCMGLEESLQTRFLKDATFEDVDQHGVFDSSSGQIWSPGMGRAGALTRQEAALALHRGGPSLSHKYETPGQNAASLTTSPEVIEESYRRTILNPRVTQRLEALCRLSRRPVELLLPRATALAKHFTGARRARGDKVDKLLETAAACVVLAAEQVGLPIPLAELRTMDPTIRDIEVRRRDIISETKRTEEFDVRLRSVYAKHLIRYYIRLLYLQRSAYETACKALYEAIQFLVPTTAELAQLVDAERVAVVVLLARTDPRLQWPTRPDYSNSHLRGHSAENDPDEEKEGEVFTPASAAAFYLDFAKLAQLPSTRVVKVMEIITPLVPKLIPIFQQKYQLLAKSTEHCEGGLSPPVASAPTISDNSKERCEESPGEGERRGLGVKRRRSLH